MEKIAEDAPLDYELQELYIESSHWLSDISFVEDEIRFLKKALNKYLAYTENLQQHETTSFTKILALQHLRVSDAKIKIAEFLKFIEPLILHNKTEIGLDLLEKYASLEMEIRSLSEYVRLVKHLVFSFIEEAIKTGKVPDVFELPNTLNASSTENY